MAKPCVLWQGAPMANGYGRRLYQGKRWLAHRLAWHLAYGPIPDGMFVCHRCDVRLCVEPTHLFLGTHKDNMADMTRKGRHPNQSKTHCPRGHEYTHTRDGARRCRACDNESVYRRRRP